MKVNGIDVDDIVFLHEQIKSHFGSVKNFCMDSRVSYRRALTMFNKLEFKADFYENVKSNYYSNSKPQMKVFGRISPEDRELIRVCVVTNFKSASKFCLKHKEYDSVYVSNIISGRLKTITPKYVGLIKLLEKKYKLKLN
jgi:hypothetical protein